ncbi:hypothetical protein BJY00DRAFT_318189 [Aspergillus carlsbadensis]|nr:hypothetical protein BJY00DRAFT_318189 [Aspergillus carlsbadensis]
MSSYLFLYIQPHPDQSGAFAQWRQDLLPADLLLDIKHTHTLYLDATTPPQTPQPTPTSTYTHLNIYRFATQSAIHSPRLKSHLRSLFADTRILSLHWRTYTSITETKPPSQSPPVVVMVGMTVPTEDASACDELDHWYTDEHIPALARVEGWMSSIRMELVDASEGYIEERKEVGARETGDSVPAPAPAPYLAVHEWDEPNGLGGEVWQAAIRTPSTAQIEALQIVPMQRSVWGSSSAFETKRETEQ